MGSKNDPPHQNHTQHPQNNNPEKNLPPIPNYEPPQQHQRSTKNLI